MSFLIRDTFSILSQRLYNNRRAQHEACPHTVFRVPLFFTRKPPRNTDINLQYKFYSTEVNAQRCCDSKQPTNPHWRRTSCIFSFSKWNRSFHNRRISRMDFREWISICYKCTTDSCTFLTSERKRLLRDCLLTKRYWAKTFPGVIEQKRLITGDMTANRADPQIYWMNIFLP